jgi:biopolymer transport protein ExbB
LHAYFVTGAQLPSSAGPQMRVVPRGTNTTNATSATRDGDLEWQ